MELWIRSQDKKELVKTNDIYLVRENKYFHIYCYANNSEIDLGQYGDFEDKTRALEVLDEIQKYINNDCKFLVRERHTSMGTYKNEEQMRVYEMPED